ncbi:MAG: glycosyltransferase family 4 protein [Leadbetterella sp.]|nr:glycosyltransferase family 4 protein [Leadbetterella sp.]
MVYFFAIVLMYILEILYFKIAYIFNIIDKPNDRSSHTHVTLRGGGIIFYIAALFYCFTSGFQYPFFFLGLTLIALVSFSDDIFTLSNRLRLAIQFIAVGLMAFQLQVFEMPWYLLILTLIIAVGVINAYNFMDGINGITAVYSLAVGGLLMSVNRHIDFIDQNLLIYTLLGVLVFAFFNFRTRALCFAGDVGSVSIAFILLFALGALVFKTQNLIYILFLSVYGTDTVWTIGRRVRLRENIFKAHRSHLFQLLANEAGGNQLLISFIYGALQVGIGYAVICASAWDKQGQLLFAFALLTGMGLFYGLLKSYVIRKYVKSYPPFTV